MCCDYGTEHRKGSGLLAHSFHIGLVVTPDVAIVESLRSEIAPMQRLTGADVIPEFFDKFLQRAAVAEPTPPAAVNRFMSEDTLPCVVVDEPDFAPVIDLHAGVAIHGLAEEEAAAMVGDDPDRLVDVHDALALQGEFVFFGYGDSSPRCWHNANLYS